MEKQNAALGMLLAALLLSGAFVTLGLVWTDRAGRDILDRASRDALLSRAAENTLLVYRQALPALEDPWSEAWAGVPAIEVPLLPQKVAAPMLDTSSVEVMQVQALTDGREIVWCLRWPDEHPEQNVDTGRFTDAVAIQFPLGADAPFTMGGPGARVQVLHWKGLWQKDLDEHFQDVQDLHPNFWADLYWFATGSFPYRVPEAFADPRSHAWFPAVQAGNPISSFYRSQPVEELCAEGFGTLTTHDQSASGGRGVWRDGWWSVLIHRPLSTSDPLDVQFHRGSGGMFGVAVWDGDRGNVGGRKHYSNWIRYEVQS